MDTSGGNVYRRCGCTDLASHKRLADSSRSFPAVPEYCRCTPTVWALLQITRLIDQQHPVRMPQLGRDEDPHVSMDLGVAPTAAADQVLHAAGTGSPACSAIVQQFFTGNGANIPGEAGLDGVHQLAEQLRPSLSVYS